MRQVSELSTTKPAVQDVLVGSISAVVSNVFSIMLDMKSMAAPAYREDSMPTTPEIVFALVGIAGSWIGSGMLVCSPRFACRMASAMLSAEYEWVNGDVLDAVAEISNMVFGNVKSSLEDAFGPLGMSIPTVVFGKNFTTRNVGRQMWTVVPVSCGADHMDVRFCIAPDCEPNNKLMQNGHTPSIRPM